MCAPTEVSPCEVCLRRVREDEWKLADGTVIRWTGCLCDAPDEVAADWLSRGYPALPRRAKKPMVVNGTPVEGPVSFHPMIENSGDMIDGLPVGKANPVEAIRDQQLLLDALSKATPEQVAKMKALLIDNTTEAPQ